MYKTSVAIATTVASALWTQSASAAFWSCPPVPEIDASSGIAAIALVMSIGAVVYRKLQS